MPHPECRELLLHADTPRVNVALTVALRWIPAR
jgi:hypothetical protein